MGNSNIKIQDTTNNLKRLYSSDIEKLDKLRLYFDNNRRFESIEAEKNILDNLFKNQAVLKKSNKIPEYHYLKVDNFLNQVKSDLSEFELKNITNKTTYENRQFDNIFENVQKENILEENNIDPYELYGFDKKAKINLDELKQKYKLYAKQTHPDRNKGSKKNFQIIQKAYEKLYEDYKLKQEDKQFNQLKTSSLDFLEKQKGKNTQNTKFNKDNFDLNQFNKIYNENKLEDLNDNGYEDWINNNSYDTEEIQRNTKLTGRGNDTFNKTFDSEVVIQNNQLQKYNDPRELFMNQQNNCSELGVDKIENYSGQGKTIKYTDYKEAHTTNRLVDPNTKFKQYRNINELEHARSNIKDFTQEELDFYEEKQKKQELYEKERIEKQNYLDQLHFKNYERLNNIMLQ